MNTERIVLVGAVWAALLLVLLVLRELLRAMRARSRARIMPVLDRLVVVMIVAFALAAVIRVGTIVSAPGLSTPSGSETPSNPIAAASPSPSVGESAVPTGTGPLQTPRKSPLASVGPAPSPTPALPTFAPSPAPTPTPVPTLVVTPAPTPTPVVTPTPPAVVGGMLTLPSNFRVYDVQGDAATGFHDVHASAGVSARASAPGEYSFATFSNPSGTVRLVRILSGPYAGVHVSPDDPGVRYTPDG